MKFLLSPDSYKGSLSAKEVAENMELGIKSIYGKADVVKFPIADGGEGTVEALVSANHGDIHHIHVTGPTGAPVLAKLGVFNKKTAVIEVAAASGLTLIPTKKRNPYYTTSFGTGELIKYALDEGCREIIVGLGGSATNDGGIGMAQALGVKLYKQSGQEISHGGQELINIEKIDMSQLDARIYESNIIIASDVTNPLCGKEGASAVFGPQKGACPEMVEKLDKGLKHLAQKIKEQFCIDVLHVAGAGAAGGLGAGLIAFLSGKMRKGIDIVFEYTDIEKEIKTVDYVITGEGFTDKQTIYGKAPYGIASLAKEYKKPVICISGGISTEIDELFNSMDVIIGVVQSPMNLSESMKNAAENVQYATASIVRTLLICESDLL